MTKPETNSIKALMVYAQPAIVIVGLCATWFTMENRVSIAETMASANAERLAAYDSRLRSVEANDIRYSEQMRGFQDDIEEIKDGQAELIALFRQLLQRGAIDPR